MEESKGVASSEHIVVVPGVVTRDTDGASTVADHPSRRSSVQTDNGVSSEKHDRPEGEHVVGSNSDIAGDNASKPVGEGQKALRSPFLGGRLVKPPVASTTTPSRSVETPSRRLAECSVKQVRERVQLHHCTQEWGLMFEAAVCLFRRLCEPSAGLDAKSRLEDTAAKVSEADLRLLRAAFRRIVETKIASWQQLETIRQRVPSDVSCPSAAEPTVTAKKCHAVRKAQASLLHRYQAELRTEIVGVASALLERASLLVLGLEGEAVQPSVTQDTTAGSLSLGLILSLDPGVDAKLPQCELDNLQQAVEGMEETTSTLLLFMLTLAGDAHRHMCSASSAGSHEFHAQFSRAKLLYLRVLNACSILNFGYAHPLRLAAAMNFSVLLHDNGGDNDAALRVSQHAFSSAVPHLHLLRDDTYKEVTFMLQLLRHNIAVWSFS